MRTLTVFLLAGALAAPFAAHAQTYPTRTIRVVVPFTAGGSSDFTARTVSERLGPALGGQVIVENKPGGNTVIATEMVAKSAPDGYTLLAGGATTLASQPHLYKKLPYDVQKDLVPVNNAVVSPLVLSVHPSVPVKNLQELLAYMKANPGKVNYGSAGVGNTLHLAGELLTNMTGVKITHVPYKGASQAITDLLSGNIQMMFDVVQTPLQHIRAGKLRPIATTWDKRASVLPEVPTMTEAGLPGYVFGAMIGFYAPAGLPRDILVRLNSEISKIVATPEVKEAFAKQAMETAPFPSPEAHAVAFRAEIVNMGKIIREAGIQPE
ncbi:MAG: tripartite tricarboxylate transporter substrate binding protein [Betaproteobacteria bacterium]|nr:tripartite tricarboxylate transporter substrate binding protein [Betaproteobacteria bacterium]